ncbi:hypothetical protein ABZX77_51765 [Streptomyces sp. NPDC004237]
MPDRLTTRLGGLVRPSLQLVSVTENKDVPAVITRLDHALLPPRRPGTAQ